MPTEPCNVHGGVREQTVAEAAPPEVPRAELAADLSEVKPVILKSPTLLAENDPYNSIKSISRADTKPDEEVAEQPAKIDNPERIGAREEFRSRETEAARAEVGNQTTEKAPSADERKPVLRAIPVEPQPRETPVEIRRAVPVGPMDEVEEGTLLKAATPSPPDSDNE